MAPLTDEPWSHFGDETPDDGEILNHLWKNIVALFLVPAFFPGFAYVRFLRIDLR